MRKRPEIEPPETLAHRQIDLVVQTRDYQLITPLYGGGVTPGEVDPLTPVRGAEIRGHLRFWWRATRGGLFGDDMAAMKKREGEIWGQASQKEEGEDEKTGQETQNIEGRAARSSVQIEIVITQSGERRRPFNLERNRNGNLVLRPAHIPEYAAFPLRPPAEDLQRKTAQQIEQEMKNVQYNIRFLLHIAFPPEYQDDIQAALWAWETFGGIGARTRRGFGALRLLKVGEAELKELPRSNRPAEVRAWLHSALGKYVAPAGNWPTDVPHLEQTLLFAIACPGSNAFESWDRLMKHYVSFRQFRTKGYTGRSNWPEAEAIREQTGRRYYAKLNHPEKFPRAAFGLPILFHFKDERKGDPHDTTLQGAQEGHERLASPLILRPLICGDGSAIGLAVVLKGSRIPPLVLKETGKSVQARLSKNDLPSLPDLDSGKLNGQTDILQAFLNDLEGK